MNWQVKEHVRALIEFQSLNLIENWPQMPLMDIVFIRNVLIYFDVQTKKDIFNKIKLLLPDAGFMFLGGAENTLNVDDEFRRLEVERASAYQLRSSPPLRAKKPPDCASRYMK
jgi:chemotaxis protein methyltransferase CheR